MSIESTENVDCSSLEAQLPIYGVPVLKSLYKFILSITQGPTIWVPGLLGVLTTKNLGSVDFISTAQKRHSLGLLA